MPTLVLASSSPRRLALLATIGITPTRVVSPNIDETPLGPELPRALATRLAHAKAHAVADPGFVLAADTVIAVGRRVVAAPNNATDAAKCLALLSGRKHHAYTCVVLRTPDGRLLARMSETAITFCRLSAPQHAAYIASNEWHGKAGGYAIQGIAASFVRALSGSHSGVVGLPLFETAQLLRGHGWAIP